MKKGTVIGIVFLFLLVVGVIADTTLNPLTKGQADTLYCPQSGGCGGGGGGGGSGEPEVNQNVNTTGSPTFVDPSINSLTFTNKGNISTSPGAWMYQNASNATFIEGRTVRFILD